MTVAELIAELEKLDKDLPVVGEWEGIMVNVKAVAVKDDHGREVVALDVDI